MHDYILIILTFKKGDDGICIDLFMTTNEKLIYNHMFVKKIPGLCCSFVHRSNIISISYVKQK